MSNPGGNGIANQIDNSIFANLTDIEDLQGSGRRHSNPPPLSLSEIAENQLFLDSEEPNRAESPKDTEVKNTCGEDEATDGSVVQPPLNNITEEVEPPPSSSSIIPEGSNAMHDLVNDNANGNNNGGGEERFVIRKKLTKSDVGRNRRLTLGKELVKEHILPHLNETQKNQITSDEGLPVKFYDQDERKEYDMTIRKPSSSYYFAGNWGGILRKRRLKKANNVGLYWVDAEDTSIPRSSPNVPHFCFSVL